MCLLLELKEYLDFYRDAQFGWQRNWIVDVHILGSAKLLDLLLWSFDKRLKLMATELGIAYI